MRDIVSEVRRNIEMRGLLEPGQRLMVALSGGLDSMVLLDVLDRLREKHRWQLTIAHLNHRLRGRSSDADERLVRRISKERQLPVVAARVNVHAMGKKRKLSIEMAARQARHHFLAQASRKRRIPTIALAHHADDQVELFFLRLFRGSGSEGLGGMKWRSPSPVSRKVEIIRPLLNIPRSALEQYARENKIFFREDATNQSLAFQRNRIRHELLPLLRKKYQPAIAATVLRVADIVSGEAEYVTNAAREWLKLRRGGFGELAIAVQRRVLQLQLLDCEVVPEYEFVERLRVRPGEAVTLPKTPGSKSTRMARTKAADLAVVRDEDGMVRLREIRTNQFRNESERVAISGPKGQIEFGGATIEWAIRRQPGMCFPKFHANSEFFDADLVGSPILLRHWRPGDRFQPIGMAKSVKIQDLLVNQKVPKELRKGLIIATTTAGELFWVEKLRISERFRLHSRTKRRLQWRWRRF